MDTVGETSFATPGDRELEITRTFDAPRQAVFDTRSPCARRLGGGWARRGGRSPGARSTCDRAGVHRFAWKSPQGYEVDNGGTCDEVSAPERLVTTQDAGAGRTRHTVVLTDDGAKTTMTYVVEYPTGEMRDAAAAMPMKEAMDMGYEKLADYLARSAP